MGGIGSETAINNEIRGPPKNSAVSFMLKETAIVSKGGLNYRRSDQPFGLGTEMFGGVG